MPSSSSSSNNNDQKEIETMEIPVPLWVAAFGVTLLAGTLTIVHRADDFGPHNYQFKRTFCIFYTTLWLATVTCCCCDAVSIKKSAGKSVQGRRPRRSGWV
mmetsp:Transcript_21780/g.31180  ORF Transcript_21780/g.31180 Transcript_21780/m.31180 type:complete len:101 (+) Transcript_21780:175-477(+)|eukprot:CAMPEP_0201707696 /NCGR_PEP_ID=MMETSP0578-20130828/52873_1 /ASSEMBLY_ACC=CAM_ASM_000663 /TAXON_ID=267565 /ORGANISM="Skeletonema grethea, Strain CCMP 1804" /LENGTH=100 /DNA_ID=CAMNT_0048196385 /DNA_START=127 /DNA_END=429 /DNA_ORIENTATION=+